MAQYGFHCQILYLCIAVILFTFIWLAHLFSKRRDQSDAVTHYPILGFLPSLIRNRHRFHDWIADILSVSPSATCKLHRPGGVKGYVTANPAIVEHLLKTRFENYEKGPRLKFILHDFLGRGIINVDGELWKMQRKAASCEFNTKCLRNFVLEMVHSEITGRLMPVFSDVCNKRVPVNLQDVLHRFSFDNICRVAFGVDPAYLHPSMYQLPFARAFDDAMQLSIGRFFYSVPCAWKIKRFLIIGSERRLREAIAAVDKFALGIIQNKKCGPLRGDLLSRFMATFGSSADTDGKSDRFLRDLIVNFMLAAADTSSNSLTWLFWMLSMHPTVEQRIRREIMKIFKKRKVQNQTDKESEKGVVFSYEELREMEYLHAAVCESLRLYPPVPLNSKTALQDDILPDGSFVGKGWSVDYSAYAMGRMESIWGVDYNEFKPERWFKKGELVGENAYKFPAFNAGPRICLGKEMAFMQMKSIVAAVVQSYSVKVEEGFVATYSLDFNMRMKGGLPVTLTKRGR